MEYEPVIGLEIHAHIKTRSKQFCRCPAVNTRELAEANKHVCPVCLGHPGVLPVLNEESVILAMAFGMAIGAEIAQRSIFARKHYFYPDLPKGYQITQYKTPLVSGGELEYRESGVIKAAKLQRAHLEEDTAKIFYQADGGVMLDYNRAGIPLLEIVTEPCFKSASEAVAFAEELRKVLKEMGVSEASMEDGSFRCEPNISVRPVGETELRTKTEVKNLNSFAIIRKALDSEYHRQVSLYEAGGCVQPCTMRWDEGQGRTIPMRSKETQADYRYFDEPDLPPLILDEQHYKVALNRYESSLLDLSFNGEKRRFPAGTARIVEFLISELSLSEADAALSTEDRQLMRLILSGGPGDYVAVTRFLINEVRPAIIADPSLRPRLDSGDILELIKMLQRQEVSYGQMKEMLKVIFVSGCKVGEAYVKLGFDQQVGGSDLADACAKVIESSEKAVADIRKGKSVALQVLVGQVMKATHGKAKPEEAVAELKKQLGL
jgi:aspartyl-tRNA(Asn)/glutamyl-tRNA(Gln) amidotransferase subunit B